MNISVPRRRQTEESRIIIRIQPEITGIAQDTVERPER
nr:MAG TPA: hypothetical protein [Caudoviricetes sp.]